MLKKIKLLFLFVITIQIANAQTKALYVNDLKHIIGHHYKENKLLQFAKDSGYTYLACYNIYWIHKNIFDITDSTSAIPLSDFIVKAKTQFGIEKVGAIGETYAPFEIFQDYNLDHIDNPNARFDIFNMEFEFWNQNAIDAYYCADYLTPNGFSCDTAGAFAFILPELCKLDSMCDQYDWLNSEIYIGHPTDMQCAKLAKCADRVLVHYYRTSDVYNDGNSIYNYNKGRLPALTDSVDFIHVMPIFSGEDYFMGPWLETHPESQAFHTWLYGQNAHDDETGAWKDKMNIDGYIWFKYTDMCDTTPSPPPVFTGKIAFHNYTDYATGDGQLFIYDFDKNTLENISSSWTTIENTINPHFSPDGSKLTFMGWNQGTNDWDIFIWDVGSSSNPTNLTHARNNRDEDPKFSPNGKKIIYKERYWDNGSFKYRFQEMDLTGTIVNTIDPPGDYEVSMPFYTPNGVEILYARGDGSNSEIYSIKTDGSNNTPYQNQSNIQEYYPTTINNQKYLFTRWIDASTHVDQIYLGNGTTSSKLPFDDEFDYSDAFFIKDNYIIFSSTRPEGKGGYDLYIGDINTGDVWSFEQYFNGINTSKEELGASYSISKKSKPVSINYIAVDNIGYRPDDGKIAILRNPVTGYDSNESYSPGTTYQIKNLSDSTVVSTITPAIWKNGDTHDQSGDKIWWLDFTSFNTPGDYFITESGKDTGSYAFSINENVYDDILKEAVRTFYYQRCGIAKEIPYADSKWTDEACHLDTEQDLDCRLVTNPVASTSKDLSGGWHDAGDHNKYINFTDMAVHDLLSAYEENPKIWSDNYNLPESGNGIPDILDEIKYELDWMLKMQTGDGSVLHKVSVTNWNGKTCPPSAEKPVRRYAPATASATINSCGVFAHAAIVFKSMPDKAMQDYGDSLETAAIDAWNWIDANPGEIPSNYDNNGFVNATAEDDSYTQYANITAASSYLLVLTGDTTTYRTYFDNHYQDTHLFQWWSIAVYFKDPQINEALLYYSVSPFATPSVVTNIHNRYMAAMTNSGSNFPPINVYNDSTDAYRAYLYNCGWGSNAYKAYGGSSFSNVWVYGLDPSNNDKHRDAAQGYIHYFHGTNPFRQLYLSNLSDINGENSVPEFYHGWFEDESGYDNIDTSMYGPAPGFLVGGPNETYQSPGSGTIEPPENQPWLKSYKNWNNVDDHSWEITENQDRYQSAYIKLLANFVSRRYSPLNDQYYVSTSGDNNNPGTLQLPWRDIDYACNNATPGSTVNVMQGTYFEQISVGVDSLLVHNYIGQPVIIDGTNITSGAIIEINDRKNITFDGFELQNNIHNDAQGILVDGECHDIEIKNCKIHDIHFSNNANDPANSNTNAQPLIVFGSSTTPSTNIKINNNEIYDSRVGYSEALAINGNIDTFEIINNSVHDITNIGIVMIGHEQTCSDPALDQARNGICKENTTYKCSSPYAANAGIYIDGAKDITIERNTCYRNIWGIEIGCEHSGKTSSGIKVRNNVIYRNAKAGIALGGYDYPSGSGKVIDTYIYNNTLFDNDTLNDYEAEINITYAENCKITNNIVYGKNTDNLLVLQYSNTAPVNVSLDSNLYYHPIGINDVEFEWQNTSYSGFGNWQSGTGQDANTVFDNPDFVDISSFPPDLHLTNTSPAIETGTNNGLTVDRDSIPRPLLATNDKGAYEFGIYWIGQISNDWHTAGNWSNNSVPTAMDDVTIPPPEFYKYYPEINTNAQINKIYLCGNSQLIIKSGINLNIGN